jgi:hypothetical protein
MNYKKTDNGRLVYSFGCIGDANAAARKMESTVSCAKGRGTILAQHVMQSFAVGETTPDEAHEIGKIFADEFLGGKYKYVLSTHVDKEHIHNHLIFCNIDNVEKKSFEYTRNRGKTSWKDVRELSDKLCVEHQKSVIPSQTKKSSKHIESSFKYSFSQKLMLAIDREITESNSFEDFLEKMRERGIVCEYNPGHEITLKFKMPGAKKNIRAGKLGCDYDEKGIRRRIHDMALFRTGEGAGKHRTKIIDTTAERINESPHLARWAIIHNIKEVSKQVNLLTEKGVKIESDGEKVAAQISELNQSISVVSSVVYNLETAKKHKPVIDELRNLQSNPFAKKKLSEFKKAHKNELEEYEKARYMLSNIKNEYAEEGEKYLPVSELKKQLERLKEDRTVLRKRYKSIKNELLEIDYARKHIREYLSQNEHLREDSKQNNTSEKSAEKSQNGRDNRDDGERDERG